MLASEDPDAPPFISDSFGVAAGEGLPGSPPRFILRRSLRPGFFPGIPGIAGADRGKPWAGGRESPPIPPGNLKPPGNPPGNPPDMGELAPPCMGDDELTEFKPGRGRPARSACNARALAMISVGKALAAAGLRALFRMPETLELGLIPGVPPLCGSETVRREGTRLGRSVVEKLGIASEEELGGSSGVLASEDSSASEPGEAGLLSYCSSGVAGTDESGESDIAEGMLDSTVA